MNLADGYQIGIYIRLTFLLLILDDIKQRRAGLSGHPSSKIIAVAAVLMMAVACTAVMTDLDGSEAESSQTQQNAQTKKGSGDLPVTYIAVAIVILALVVVALFFLWKRRA